MKKISPYVRRLLFERAVELGFCTLYSNSSVVTEAINHVRDLDRQRLSKSKLRNEDAPMKIEKLSQDLVEVSYV